MRIIVLNQSNIVPDGQNNKLVYQFPNSVQFKDNYIAVSSVTMYYSWFNITSAYNNNKFSYTWTDATGLITTYDIVIPDGLYQVSTLNDLLQFNMIKNNTYLIDPNGLNVYYAEIILNTSRYAVQINTYLVPTALPPVAPGDPVWSTPPGFPGFPNAPCNPIITIPPNFNSILGFVPNFQTYNNINNPPGIPATTNYVSKIGNGTISYLSTSAPNLQPNSSLYFALSNINNPYSRPSSIIYSLVATGTVGSIITERPPQFMWNRMIDGTYNELRLTFLGTDLSPITIQDPQMTILLTIRDRDEVGGK